MSDTVRRLNPPTMEKPPGYTHIVEVTGPVRTIYISGQIAYDKDGKVVGVRMFGIRPDTLLGTLGLQNGDRLESINGFNMASPEKALEAYARLRTADHLTVQVNRRGANQNLDYNIK